MLNLSISINLLKKTYLVLLKINSTMAEADTKTYGYVFTNKI